MLVLLKGDEQECGDGCGRRGGAFRLLFAANQEKETLQWSCCCCCPEKGGDQDGRMESGEWQASALEKKLA